MEQEPNLNIGNYGRGNNGRFVEINNTTLYFSYNTIVAFRTPGYGLKVSENIWSTTTGGHLNAIDGGDKSGRLEHEQFMKELSRLIEEKGL
jgi:hypothetical protein